MVVWPLMLCTTPAVLFWSGWVTTRLVTYPVVRGRARVRLTWSVQIRRSGARTRAGGE